MGKIRLRKGKGEVGKGRVKIGKETNHKERKGEKVGGKEQV